MAKQYSEIEPAYADFISRQKIFFVASAAPEGRINLSPKGLDCLRIISPRQVIYLDRTGSGNETAAHLLADGRLTMMFCAFDGPPLILRLYGRGQTLARNSEAYATLLTEKFDGCEPVGARHMIVLDVELVQTSCGYAVPLMSFTDDRESLDRWAMSKGEDGLEAYRAEKNSFSLDGLPTGMSNAK
jgi:hypothetical protein